jgi:hypothetical protein
MVHYGKHIIDPETGLCEICDRGAIHDFQQRNRRQFLYSNQDGKFTYRPLDASDDIRYQQDEPTPRRVRKPLYPEPTPRSVVQEEPVIQRKVPRRDFSPLDDTQNSRSARLTTFYYVDSTGQMVPRNAGPPDEPHRRYLVQSHHSPSTHPTRHHVPRRALTPPPPASESWRSRPKRQVNSDTKIIQAHRSRPDDLYSHHSPQKAEMYYIDTTQHENRFPTISSRVQNSYNNHHQGDTFRKQRQLEPIDRKYYSEQEPHVPRKTYKKLPESSKDENNLRLVRKTEKIYPSPKTYQSAPQLPNTYNRNNPQPSVYYLQSASGY